MSIANCTIQFSACRTSTKTASTSGPSSRCRCGARTRVVHGCSWSSRRRRIPMPQVYGSHTQNDVCWYCKCFSEYEIENRGTLERGKEWEKVQKFWFRHIPRLDTATVRHSRSRTARRQDPPTRSTTDNECTRKGSTTHEPGESASQ